MDKISNWKIIKDILNTDHRLIPFELERRKEKDTWERLDVKAGIEEWEKRKQEKEVNLLYDSLCSSFQRK